MASSFRWCFREQCLKYPWWDRKGRWKCAIDLLISASQTLKGKLHKLALEGSEADKPDGEEEEAGDEVPSLLQRVEEALHDIIALCQRSSHGLNQQQREVCVCVRCPIILSCFSWTGCIDLLIPGFTFLSLTVCVHQSSVTLRLCGFLSSRRWCHHRNYWKEPTPNTLQRVRQTHTSTRFEFIHSIAAVLNLCNSNAPIRINIQL